MCASIVSVNLSQVRVIEWQGQKFPTGIFKTPVKGPVKVGTLGLRGDVQADLTVHGGTEKAVYAVPFRALRVLEGAVANRVAVWDV